MGFINLGHRVQFMDSMLRFDLKKPNFEGEYNCE